MSIVYRETEKTFTLHTRNSSYQMKVDEQGRLLHTYYGSKSDSSDLSYLIAYGDRGFSGNPHELGRVNRRYSLDTLPQEYSCFGTGDYRVSALRVQNADGSQAASLVYSGFAIEEGKYGLPGLPAVYDNGGEADTLRVTLVDQANGLQVDLLYGVFEAADIITRAVLITNQGAADVVLQKAASLNLDWQAGQFDLISFHGRHAMERNFQKSRLSHGVASIGSVRGASSHHHNPFAILCEPGTGETRGSSYGFAFVYSGEFLLESEKDQMDQTRLVLGIHPDNFSWTLAAGEIFTTPEAVMTFSDGGWGGVSRNFHAILRHNVCRGEWKDKRRPVLINNWEGTYFDFDGDKLAAIAQDAAELGVELFVMDDGWFGKRDDDNSGLGDWYPNETKLGCTLKELGEKITGLGMQFGIWFEPECISEDSDLYRAHPDWAVQIPGRPPVLSRNQLILDFSRADVQDYLIERLSAVLASAPVSYVKWDFNRSISDKFSQALPAGRQGEMAHRFVLGLYRVLESLLQKFPHILFEGCSGGGGRFDAGMLYYTPQIWTSDNTDAIERLQIQYGTSFAYPVSAMGAHVSAVPNHQTGRVTSLATRAAVAMAGTFGYELDINLMTAAEKREVRMQIERFKELYELIQRGNYYRLASPLEGSCTVWQMAAVDRSAALVTAVYHHVEANPRPVYVKLQGLEAEADYKLSLLSSSEEGREELGTVSGLALMRGGWRIPEAGGDYWALQILAERLD
ncbi:MAG: alpha-galactosidase [Clostridiaceae bacterium]|nr:alpha-galactosidase [Clostridiaceae bacterium]